MIIQWLGQSCFKIQTKGSQGDIVVATDPYSDSSGLKMSHFNTDIITVSCDQENHNNIDALRGEPFIIKNPGEYETKGVFVYGVSAVLDKEKTKATLYKIISEEISVAHLSDLSQPLTDDQLDRLGNVDVLLLSVGGNLDVKKTTEIISQIDPRLVIPMNYKIASQKTTLNTADEFLKSCGLKSETMDKLKIAKKDLMTEDTRVIVLTV
jgi:L-ascorbate metabolism protein UlaG (beta-lactamase superfamily)